QAAEEKPAVALADDAALVQAGQDSSNRDLERRLRTLEERMDRLLQKLETQGGERSDGKSSRQESGSAAEEKARARDKERADKAREKAKAEQLKELKRRTEEADKLKDLKRRTEDGKMLGSEQIERLMKDIQQKVNREFDPE